MATDSDMAQSGTPAGEDASGSGAARPEAEATRVIRSEELFAGRRSVVIQHADAQYRLLITRNDRLILQK